MKKKLRCWQRNPSLYYFILDALFPNSQKNLTDNSCVRIKGLKD